MDYEGTYLPQFLTLNCTGTANPNRILTNAENIANISPTRVVEDSQTEVVQSRPEKTVFKREEFKRIVRRIGPSYQLETSKFVTKHENYSAAVRSVITVWNKLGFEQLDYKDAETREKVGFRICRCIIDKRQYPKKKEKAQSRLAAQVEQTGDQAANENEDLTNNSNQQLWHYNDNVVVTIDGNAVFIGKVSNVAPLNSAGEFIFNSVAVRKVIDLCAEAASFPMDKDHVFKPIHISKINFSLHRVHTILGAFVTVENRHATMGLDEESDGETAQQKGCNMVHTAGDIVMLDLGTQWAEFWPLLAIVKEVKGKKMKIKWLNGLIDGKYGPWMTNGRQRIQNVALNSHYFCGFELEDGCLPDDAKKAATELMAEYAAMDAAD